MDFLSIAALWLDVDFERGFLNVDFGREFFRKIQSMKNPGSKSTSANLKKAVDFSLIEFFEKSTSKIHV